MTGWERASRCECAACVEVDVRDDVVLVRDSKHPDGSVLKFTREEWAAFVDGVRGGEFDVPAPIPPGDR